MFRSTARSLRSWWSDFSDDILGADLEPMVYADDLDAAAHAGEFEPGAHAADLDSGAPHTAGLAHHLHHPHRQPLRSSRPRRHGAVAARPAYCLCPIRAQQPAADSHTLAN